MGAELAVEAMLVPQGSDETLFIDASPLGLGESAQTPEPAPQISEAGPTAASHEHSERAKEMTFEEALGAAGCSYLRHVAATRGKEEARRVFDTTQPAAVEPAKPTKLIMAPPKKKPADPPTANKPAAVEPTKGPAKPEVAAPIVLQPQPAEVLPPVVPVRAEEAPADAPLVMPVVLALPEIALPIAVHEEPQKSLPSLPLVVPSLERLAVSANQTATTIFEQLKVPELVVAPSVLLEPEAVRAVDTAAESDSTMQELVLPEAIETAALETLPAAAPGVSEAFSRAVSELREPVVEQDRPVATFAHFTEALTLLTHETPAQTPGERPEPINEHPPLEAPVAAVVAEVASRLVELNDERKEAALPIVQNITDSVRAIRQLQEEAAAPKEIVAAVGLMREQIVQLFEAIGIEYDDEKVEHFIRAMLAPQFVIQGPHMLTAEELAHMGTHEVKLDNQLAMILSQPTADELPISHRLGQIVLLCLNWLPSRGESHHAGASSVTPSSAPDFVMMGV